MERHIGVWHIEGKNDKTDVGELIIDGNHIEFHSRFFKPPFKIAFIGNDGNNSYKVFVQGYTNGGNHKTIANTLSHRVYYVLMQNYKFANDFNVSGIMEFSFIIPELTNWLGIDTVHYCYTYDDTLAAAEYHMSPIIIKSANPKIEIYFKSSSLSNSTMADDSTEINISKKPRIRVSYNKPVDIQEITSEIECLMQFFGLLIGKVSNAEDIILTIKDQDLKSWLFINHDYSYNFMTQDTLDITQYILDKPRIYYYVVEDKIKSYYSKWRKFFNNDDFSLLRRVYFSVNNKKEKYAEEVFVEYMRFLDGYHTRISGDADKEKALKDAIKESQKVIRLKIFDDEGRPIFEKEIQKVIPDWKYNEKNVINIPEVIARSYVERKGLSHRLKELDKKHFNIISKNALNIEKLPLKNNDYNEKIKAHLKRKFNNITDEEVEEKFNGLTPEEKDDYLIEIYYKELGDTRNYYSHYKKDKTGVLEDIQLSESINVLKATIISILLYHIGIIKEIRRKMLAFDSELFLKTDFLIKKDEKPFISPKNGTR